MTMVALPLLVVFAGCGPTDGGGTTPTTSATGGTTVPTTVPDPTTTPENMFDPYVFFIEVGTAYADGQLTSAWVDPANPYTELPPYVQLTFVEEAYFSDSPELSNSCTWLGDILQGAPDDMGVDTLWVGWQIDLVLIETDCERFDPAVWGDVNPTAAIETVPLGLGFGPLEGQLEESFRNVVQDWGEQWDDWQPVTFATYIGYWDDLSQRLSGFAMNFTWAWELDESLGLVIDEDGFSNRVAHLDTMPDQVLVDSTPWYGYYTWILAE